MNAITFKSVSKEYTFSNSKPLLLFAPFSRKKKEKSLRNISFTVKTGEVLGIVGENGSGKSTILKLIAGIITPSSGTISTHGKITSLIELGAGFHHDLTGLENIELNALLLGFSKKELQKKLVSIIDFADIGDHLYQPLRTYSSGMIVRLAFAVAINLDPDILLIDEVLAVGDENFQTKSLQKLSEFKKLRKTIILVSHNPTHIEEMCDRALLLKQGKIVFTGKPQDVISTYREKTSASPDVLSSTYSSSTLKISNLICKAKKIKEKNMLSISVDYKILKSITTLHFGIGIYNTDNVYLSGINTKYDRIHLKPNSGTLSLLIDISPLSHGSYYINLVSFGEKESFPYLFIPHARRFQVKKQKTVSRGILTLSRAWESKI